ncbi:MAG: rod shape-determining protein MreC [Candidatus Paceibacterota bacterium]
MTRGNSKIKFGLFFLLVVLIIFTIKPSIRMRVKKPFYASLAPVQRNFEAADHFLLGLGEVVVNLNHWQEVVTQLQKDKLGLLARNAELLQLEEENKNLREALDMELQKDFQMELVQIIGKRLEQEEIIINKGKEDGLEEGMPVINSHKVLAGKLTQVNSNTSRVRFIFHPESSFSANLKDKEMEGEVKGQGDFKIKFDFIPADEKIGKGQVVVTNALGEIYPPGLLIGEIESVKQRDVKPFQVAQVDPYYKVNNDFLFVITNY